VNTYCSSDFYGVFRIWFICKQLTIWQYLLTYVFVGLYLWASSYACVSWDLAFVMAVTVQYIVFCDVTPCSLVGIVSTFSRLSPPRVQVARELSSNLVQCTVLYLRFGCVRMLCRVMARLRMWCKHITNYCIYLQPITRMLANMYIVNHTFRLIIVAILRENVDTEKHFGIGYNFMSAGFLRMTVITSRYVPEEWPTHVLTFRHLMSTIVAVPHL